MRITNGTIYLVQPIFGRHLLEGAATVGTTWLDYTFPSSGEDPISPPQADARRQSSPGPRVLIPITNVAAVVVGDDP